MSKLANPKLIGEWNHAFPELLRILNAITLKVNLLGEGNIEGTHITGTAAPTTGAHKVGDYVRNSTPSEAGTAGSKYVILGWVCSASGTPGTWLACRSLTGN